jgi:hypothetical protein
VLESFTRIDLERHNTDIELDRIRAALTNSSEVLAAVQQYGLAEYLGAGPLAVHKFEVGETTEPVGHALVRAAVDWRRSGLSRPIPKRGTGNLGPGGGLSPRSAGRTPVRAIPGRRLDMGYHAHQRDGGTSRAPFPRSC